MISCTNSLVQSQSNEMKEAAHLKYQVPFCQAGNSSVLSVLFFNFKSP